MMTHQRHACTVRHFGACQEKSGYSVKHVVNGLTQSVMTVFQSNNLT